MVFHDKVRAILNIALYNSLSFNITVIFPLVKLDQNKKVLLKQHFQHKHSYKKTYADVPPLIYNVYGENVL
jgi:hypothetical protein